MSEQGVSCELEVWVLIVYSLQVRNDVLFGSASAPAVPPTVRLAIFARKIHGKIYTLVCFLVATIYREYHSWSSCHSSNNPPNMKAALLVLLLLLVAQHCLAKRGTPPKSLATWSFASSNRRMEWNELPQVSLSSRTTVDTTGEWLLGDETVDVLVVAYSNETTMSLDWTTSSSSRDDNNNNNTTNDDDLHHQDFQQALSLLQQEIAQSPTGTLSSRVMLLPFNDDDDVSSEKTKPQYLCCWQLGQNLTNGARKNASATEKEEKEALLELQHQQARTLGATLAGLVEESSKANGGDPSQRLTTTRRIRVILPPLPSNETWTELATAFWTNLYQDNRYKSSVEKDQPSKPPVEVHLVIVQPPPGENNSSTTTTSCSATTNIPDALQKGASLSRGVYLAKDIVNAPHNSLNAESLAETAQRLASKYRQTLSCRILSVSDCERRGMGAFLGVARGSETAAQFIHLTYCSKKKSRRRRRRRLGIVGKGLLFDTGGYNIKTQMMHFMKFDCGGAAAVLGAARAIAELEPDDVEVHFCVAACENMISERAIFRFFADAFKLSCAKFKRK